MSNSPYVVKPVDYDSIDFSPFGTLMSLNSTPKLPIDFYSGLNSVHGPIPIDADADPEFLVFRVGERPGTVRYLERHVEMAQSMIPLMGHGYVVLVASANCEELHGFPHPEALTAVRFPGDVAITLNRGTWHEPPFPTIDGQPFLITSHHRLTQGLQQPLDANGELNQLDVEKRSPRFRLGATINVAL